MHKVSCPKQEEEDEKEPRDIISCSGKEGMSPLLEERSKEEEGK